MATDTKDTKKTTATVNAEPLKPQKSAPSKVEAIDLDLDVTSKDLKVQAPDDDIDGLSLLRLLERIDTSLESMGKLEEMREKVSREIGGRLKRGGFTKVFVKDAKIVKEGTPGSEAYRVRGINGQVDVYGFYPERVRKPRNAAPTVDPSTL